MAVKKPNYTPFGDELSVEVAYLQAAKALDAGVQLAIDSAELERLETYIALWIELGRRLLEGPEFDEDDEDATDDEIAAANQGGFVVGFGKERNERVDS